MLFLKHKGSIVLHQDYLDPNSNLIIKQEERFQKLQESLNLNSSTKGKGRGKKSTSARLSEADISEQV